MMLREKMIPCLSREAVVTVISYHQGVMDGYLQHPRLRGKERIWSLSQMVLLLNSLLDLEDCLNSPLPLVHPDCQEPERGGGGAKEKKHRGAEKKRRRRGGGF